jgi:hypothetical protein
MLTAIHATPRPTTTPITNPTRKAITTRLFSFNTSLPNALFHYAPTFGEDEFSELPLLSVLGSWAVKLRKYLI